jgi:hypothetical protein
MQLTESATSTCTGCDCEGDGEGTGERICPEAEGRKQQVAGGG